jgi:hypothetical protein
MKKLAFMLVCVVCLSLVTAGMLEAQELKFPRVSQRASISQTVGLTEITITYHRPGVKGRVIWGDLVPYDKVWRTGANEATTIGFSGDVLVEGNKLAAGTYGLFTIPGKTEWTVIFSKQADIWGTFGYKEDQDVLKLKVKSAAAPHCEWLRFAFTDLAEDSARAILHWEKLQVAFTVTVDTRGVILKNIEKTLGRYWVSPFSAADYAFKNEMVDKAKKYVDVSVSVKATYWNMLLKAKVYKKLARTKKEVNEAVKILEKANMMIKDLPENQQRYAEEGPKLLKEWKAGKK